MAILNTIKKGYMHLKVGGAYIKLLPRTLATLVSMSDGRSVENAIDELNRNLQSGYTHLSEDEIGYVKFSNGLKAIYGTYPAQAMIDERPTTGGYSVTIDISKYGLKNPLFTLASPRYSQGHPTATVHSVSENAIKIGCNINYDGCFITWLVIG